jgi:hypothetical protein
MNQSAAASTPTRWTPRYYIEIRGANFFPSRVPFQFTKAWDPLTRPVTRGPHKGEFYPWGEANFAVPPTAPTVNRLKFLADIMAPLLPTLREHGAESWTVWIVRYYSAQCNESWTSDEISALARLNCNVCYSAYTVSDAEEEEWWAENGYRNGS